MSAAVRVERLPLSPRLVVSGALAVALVVGVMLAAYPPIGVVLLLAAGFIPFAFLNLPLALATWIPLVFIVRLGLFSIGPVVCLLLLALVWLGTLRREFSEYEGLTVKVHAPILGMIAALLVWMMLSALWATDPGTALADSRNWVETSIVFLLIAFVGAAAKNARAIAWAFVIGATISVLVGVLGLDATVSGDAFQTAGLVDRTRLSGGSGDPNYLAAAIVPALALLAGLVSSRQPLQAGFAVVVTCLLTYGLLATGSRGGLISAAVAIMAALVVFRNRRVYVLAFLGLLVAVAAAWLSANPAALQRIEEVNQGGTGRTELWKVALRIWHDHPLLGAGLNNFVVVSSDYVRQPGPLEFVDLIAEKPHVAHNTYLQMLAETGVIGLALYLAVFAMALRASWLATALFARRGDEQMANLSRATTIAVLAVAASSFFLSNGGDWPLWLLLGLGPALYATARRQETGAELKP